MLGLAGALFVLVDLGGLMNRATGFGLLGLVFMSKSLVVVVVVTGAASAP